MKKEISLPPEWVSLLMDKNSKVSYFELQEMSCGEVYDLLEVQSAMALRSDMVAEIQREDSRK
jgi:hypothetical protein